MIAAQRDTLARSERDRIGDVPRERHEPALAREDVLVGRLDMPERTEPERVDAEDAGVADPREDRGGTLCERTHRGAGLDVHVLQVVAHALHLVDDRREQQLDRLDRGEAVPDHEAADDRIHVLRIAPIPRQHQAERA